MTPEQFCYWLQGWFEINKTIDHREGATPETLKLIEEKLGEAILKIENQLVNIKPQLWPTLYGGEGRYEYPKPPYIANCELNSDSVGDWK